MKNIFTFPRNANAWWRAIKLFARFRENPARCATEASAPLLVFCCCVFWSKLTFRDKNEIKKRRKFFLMNEKKAFYQFVFYLFCVRSFISMKIKWEVHFPGKNFHCGSKFPKPLETRFQKVRRKTRLWIFFIWPVMWPNSTDQMASLRVEQSMDIPIHSKGFWRAPF